MSSKADFTKIMQPDENFVISLFLCVRPELVWPEKCVLLFPSEALVEEDIFRARKHFGEFVVSLSSCSVQAFLCQR